MERWRGAMNPAIREVLSEIGQLRAVLHGAGTMSDDALGAIVRHGSRRRIRRSVETGCGATTLLLSHLSEHHTVIALDIGAAELDCLHGFRLHVKSGRHHEKKHRVAA